MRIATTFALSSLLLAAGAASAAAYTPESGVWWNPQEPGSGLQLEVQDNFLVLSGYVFNEDGTPTWVTAQGLLQADGKQFTSSSNQNDGSWLNTFSGGQCIGCAYPGVPNAQPGAKGTVNISFNPGDPTKAVLTWGGRAIPIERYQFYLTRPGDNVNVRTSKMLGEWVIMIDYSNRTTPAATRFAGDVLVFDQITPRVEPERSTYSGCRPTDALSQKCTAAARAQNSVDGSYLDEGRHIFIVTETRDSAGDPLDCLLYDVRVDSNQFEGGLDGDLNSNNDGGVIPYACDTGNVLVLPAYPVRGFRSASRTVVESNAAAE